MPRKPKKESACGKASGFAQATPDKPADKPAAERAAAPAKPSAVIDTRVIYCGDNLQQLWKLPDACIDLIYIGPHQPVVMGFACRLKPGLVSYAGRRKEWMERE